MKGFLRAKKTTKTQAKTFYFASLFLPRHKRYAAYVLYAICRACDDSVDIPGSASKVKDIDTLQIKIDTAFKNRPLNDNLLSAFSFVIREFDIPKEYFDELVKGMRMDLSKTRYENFDELYSYCYKAAGVVGLMMLKILGFKDKTAESYAVKLGVAFQLTNILRDVKEDYSLGRIYLPQDEMHRFKVKDEDIKHGSKGNNLINLLKFQADRAKDFYHKSASGITMIKGLQSRFVVCAMKDVYAGILDTIENNGYDVFAERAHVNKVKKILLLFKIILKGEYL